MFLSLALILLAYLLGSISSAILVCRAMGLPDPRAKGSGNPGATNVLRIGGKLAAAATLLGDMLKGLIPMVIGQLLGVAPWVLAGIMLGAFLGHLYPVFFRFYGGKGVATALGVLWGLSWQVGLAVSATWLLVALVGRVSSLSALIAFVLAPAYVWYLYPARVVFAAAIAISLLLFWRHRSNIRALVAGGEDRIGAGPP
jgi:glycerol-3-phosphate acyltransferase PlsY